MQQLARLVVPVPLQSHQGLCYLLQGELVGAILAHHLSCFTIFGTELVPNCAMHAGHPTQISRVAASFSRALSFLHEEAPLLV
jgi:hypothetical protein